MEFKTPEWLTKEYLQNALEYGKEYKISIENFTLDMPITKGNNYVCDIYRAEVKYTKSTYANKWFSKSLIIKTPKTGPMHEYMMSTGILQKEPRMYNEFSPKLKSIFCENHPEDIDEDYDHLLADSFHSTVENVVILEDLKTKGYKMADRFRQLDYDHSILALKTLAKFHAGSVLIHEKEPEFIEEIGRETIFSDEAHEINKNFTVQSFKLFSETIRNNPQLEKYSKWFEENAEESFKTLINCLKYSENEFTVLNHGDFWINNMLFKYNDENVPVKVKAIDLQICRYTSPVFDIMYFMGGSVRDEIKAEKFDDMIHVYLNELNSNLHQYGSSRRLEKSEFDKMMKDRAFIQIYVAISILAFVVADPNSTEIFDLNDATEELFTDIEKNPMKGYYENKNYIRLVKKSLKQFEKMGLITAK